MAFSRNYSTYTKNELNLLLAIEKETLEFTFPTKKAMLHFRHRMYALRAALVLAYDKETKGMTREEIEQHQFTDPYVAITPRIVQMAILVDDLTLRIGLGLMRPGIQNVIEEALLKAGFEPDRMRLEREGKERERAILAEINSPSFGAAALGNQMDETLDALGYSVAARMKAKAAKAATGPLDMTAALTSLTGSAGQASLNTQETLALARTEALAAQAAARSAPRELSPEERAAEEEEILKLSINQTN